jgi:hypothetical protein
VSKQRKHSVGSNSAAASQVAPLPLGSIAPGDAAAAETQLLSPRRREREGGLTILKKGYTKIINRKPGEAHHIFRYSREGALDQIRTFLSKHNDLLNFQEEETGQTPLMAALLSRNLEATLAILSFNPDCTIAAADGLTPLHALMDIPNARLDLFYRVLNAMKNVDLNALNNEGYVGDGAWVVFLC